LEIGSLWNHAEFLFCFGDDMLKFGKMPTDCSKLVWGVSAVEAGLLGKDVVIECELGGIAGCVRDCVDMVVALMVKGVFWVRCFWLFFWVGAPQAF
jgi:hypothetical protein